MIIDLPFTELRFKISITKLVWKQQVGHLLWHGLLAYFSWSVSLTWAICEEFKDGILKPTDTTEYREGFNIWPDIVFRSIGILLGWWI
jgi:hypothetical protein